MAEITREERSLGELLNELSRETSTLVRQEVQLAKVEVSQTATKVGKNLAYLAVGAAILYAAFLALMFGLIFGLAEFLEGWLWLSALIVALIVGAVGGFLVYQGYEQLKKINLIPDRTIDSLQEDAEWLKQQVE